MPESIGATVVAASSSWVKVADICLDPSGSETITLTPAGTCAFGDPAYSYTVGPSGRPDPTDAGYPVSGIVGVNTYSLCILLRETGLGAPPLAPAALDPIPNPGGVTQTANALMLGSEIVFTAVTFAAFRTGLSGKVTLWAIYCDDKYSDNSGSLTISGFIPSHAPATPTGLHTVDACENAQITLDWTEGTTPDDATPTARYNVEVDGELVDDDNITDPHYVLTDGIVLGMTYAIQVQAVDECGNVSAWTSILYVTPCDGSAYPPVDPPPVLSLQLAGQLGCEGPQFTATWTDVEADRYDIILDGAVALSVTGSPAPHTAVIPDLVLRRTYRLWVVAIREGFTATQSNRISIRPCCSCRWTPTPGALNAWEQQAAAGGTWTPVQRC